MMPGQVSSQKENVILFFKKGREYMGSYRLVASLNSVSGKLSMEAVSEHMRGKMMIRSSQHRFSKDKLCLTDLEAFCNEMIGFTGNLHP